MITNVDKGLFKDQPYTYGAIKVSKDLDSRLSRKDSWKIKQMNENIYLTTPQMRELRDSLDTLLSEV